MKTSVRTIISVPLSLILLFCFVFSVFAGETTTSTSSGKIADCKIGDIIEFGYYPQKLVSDETLISSLEEDNTDWTDYGYISGTGDKTDGKMIKSDYMKYKDVVLGDSRYRGVLIQSYRPSYIGDASSAAKTFQDERGYLENTVYWFEYEPIKWMVLDPSAGLVLSLSIIDAQSFSDYSLTDGTDEYNNSACWGNEEKTYYSNNYEFSYIRRWLNDAFYNTAFFADQQAIISSTELDNSAYSDTVSAYGSASTSDKVFLLSWNDVINSNYGFSSSTTTQDYARRTTGTDYAKSQGLFMFSVQSSFYGCSNWLLRSAAQSSDKVGVVFYYGTVGNYGATDYTAYGVRPAIVISPEVQLIQPGVLGRCEHEWDDGEITCPANCIDVGSVEYSCKKCGERKTDEIPVNPAVHKNIVTDSSSVPTCTANGLTEGTHCDACNTILIQQQSVACIPHNYSRDTLRDVPVSCTLNGLSGYSCSSCGDTADIIIPATGHSSSVWKTETSPDCIREGIEYTECTICKERLETKVIPIADHCDNDNNGLCDVCGADISSGNCSHICHTKNAFLRFIWKIIRFFCKLFGINQHCACGISHW